MSVLDLARPEIRTLQPYSSARMEAGNGQIMLNANESAWPPAGDVGLGCNRYPDPQPEGLRVRGEPDIALSVGAEEGSNFFF